MHQDDELKSLLLIKDKFDSISSYLNERALRIWCATEAKNYNKVFGLGGVTAVHRATDVARPTIYSGLRELKSRKKGNKKIIRKSGGGRKKITNIHPSILKDLENLVEPLSRGDPMSPLRWTTKSVRNISKELNKKGYAVRHRARITFTFSAQNGVRFKRTGRRKIAGILVVFRGFSTEERLKMTP
jgi:Rhodopirellula transposase DDE domain